MVTSISSRVAASRGGWSEGVQEEAEEEEVEVGRFNCNNLLHKKEI
jgi:hypothetical protein